MTFFDLIVIGLLVASIVAGALRGVLGALLTMAALVIGLIVAARGYAAMGALLNSLGFVESREAAHALGFLCIACASLLFGFLAGRLLTRGMRRARLEWLDRVLGAAFGALRGLLLCSVLYLALTAFPLDIDSVTEARSAPLLGQSARLLAAVTSEELHRRVQEQYRELIGEREF